MKLDAKICKSEVGNDFSERDETEMDKRQQDRLCYCTLSGVIRHKTSIYKTGEWILQNWLVQKKAVRMSDS